jgi:acetyl esterase
MFKVSTESGKVILVTGANKQQERESPLMGDLDPQVKTLLEQFQAKAVQHSAPATPRSAIEKVVASRQRVSASAALGIALEAVSKAEDFDIPGPAGRIPVRLYVPHTEDSLPPTVPALVYYHGGGFVAGDLESHDRLLRALANRGRCIVVSAAYRLAPENPYPAGHDDAWAALMWVAAHASDIGADPQRLAVGGIVQAVSWLHG